MRGLKTGECKSGPFFVAKDIAMRMVVTGENEALVVADI